MFNLFNIIVLAISIGITITGGVIDASPTDKPVPRPGRVGCGGKCVTSAGGVVGGVR